MKSRQGAQSALESEQYRFLAKVILEKESSNSQVFQDLWVLYELGNKSDGYFIEFGAADGIYLSNTYLLEKEFAWTGILAEPSPYWHDALARNRSAFISHKCISGESNSRTQLYVPKSSAEYGTIVADLERIVHASQFTEYEVVEVDTVALVDLLREYDAPATIDYISMDVEGAEESILQSFDFEAYDVTLWTIEQNLPGSAVRIERIMAENGYCRCFPEFSMFDGWYRKRRSNVDKR